MLRFKKKKFAKKGQLRSKLEQLVDKQLKESGVSYAFESEFLSYTLEKKYLPDFIVSTKSGKKIYIEAKGWFKGSDRTKMLSVKRNNPSLDIRMLFSSDNKISKGSKTRYSDWCKKHKMKYCFKKIPSEWLK